MIKCKILILAWLGGSTGQHLVQAPTLPVPITISTSLPSPFGEHSELCPNLYNKTFPNHVPYGLGSHDNNSISFKFINTTDINSCVSSCCWDQACNSVLVHLDGKFRGCWEIYCLDDSLCLPVLPARSNFSQTVMALVRPIHPPWDLNRTESLSSVSTTPLPSDARRVCEVGLDTETCHQDEVCKATQDKSRNGVCSCKPGLVRDQPSLKCLAPAPTPTAPPVAIAVSVASKQIQLPQNSASLAAYPVPTETLENPYKYEWKLVTMTGGSQTAVEENSNTQTLKLSSLEEGVYQFKVTVTSRTPAGYGEALANVTVLAAKRINAPPKASIIPATQTVNLPTNKAIVDGSGSTDDSTQPLTYAWEIISGPVGYQPTLLPSPTLTLENLIAGNYTIRLTVSDEDGGSDSASAILIVLKATDYKPKANAGEDKIIFLPTNTVTLNGNQSYDDHSIKTYEWTKEKGANGKELPADISESRSELMTASNLEEGIYNFVLKVTDEAGQQDTDKVAVYVKPPTNLPPVANAGPDKTLSLPILFFSLDGSKSKDDGNITSYKWTLVKGPDGKSPKFSSENSAMTNVTNLTVGLYTFQLAVTDNSGNKDTDNVEVLIKQDTNQAPVSNPGPDIKVSLPTDTVVLDGQGSSDDLAVERWLWTRDPSSLAAGQVVGGHTLSTLTVADLVPGSYSFTLTVSDSQGKTDNKSVKVTVLEDPNILSDVEIVLDKNLSHFSRKQQTEVLDRIRVMTKGKGEISVGNVKLYGAQGSGLATLRFKVFSKMNNKASPMPGQAVVDQLKRELTADSELLAVPVVSIKTSVCQNKCGGHGECDQATRECVCQPAWMENVINRRFRGKEANCDWSVVYVCIIAGGFSFLLFFVCCLASCRRRRESGGRISVRKYSRLNTAENGMDMQETLSSMTHSETDSEEEVLFESTKKGRRLNGTIPRVSNGFVKNGKNSKLNT